ncbi:unnamed protein product [Hermetia illucens]|uniref:Uncharacterized protein n=1 Tax=Hermetia illucens TaxID=343691 RepID=A0A7R8UYV8_HERIL|nr:unnamed protein product [Hermetia illucens]
MDGVYRTEAGVENPKVNAEETPGKRPKKRVWFDGRTQATRTAIATRLELEDAARFGTRKLEAVYQRKSKRTTEEEEEAERLPNLLEGCKAPFSGNLAIVGSAKGNNSASWLGYNDLDNNPLKSSPQRNATKFVLI